MDMMGKLFSKRSKSAGSSRPAQISAASEAALEDCGDKKSGTSNHIHSVKLQHSDAVVSVACSQPGLCLSGSKDMCVSLYDYNAQQLIEKWLGHTGPLTKVCYGLVCDKVFSSSRDKTVKLWERGHSCFKKEFVGHSLVVTAIHLNKDNSLLCSGSRDNTVKLWDVETSKCIKTNCIAQNLVTDLKFLPDSSAIIQTGEDKMVRIFDVRLLEPVFTFPSKQYIQMCCDISSDGHYVVSSSNGFSGSGCEVTVWDIRSRKMLRELFGHREAVEACMFLPSSNAGQVLTASRDCSVKLWNANTGAQESEYFFTGSGPLTSLAAYQDNSILIGSFNHGTNLLSLKDKNLVKVMNF